MLGVLVLEGRKIEIVILLLLDILFFIPVLIDVLRVC